MPAAELRVRSLALSGDTRAILVTYDTEIAEKAYRSIRMQFGRLLEPTLA